MIITIDGPSGTGKSAAARGLAQRLAYLHVDTGAMYRAFAHWVLIHGADLQSEEAVSALIPSFDFHIQSEGETKRYWVGDEEVTAVIRTRLVTDGSALVAVFPEVRRAIVAYQRAIGAEADSVFEGRDLGTVVFPQADFKVYLTARAQVRAARRHAELLACDPIQQITLQEVLDDQNKRDDYDCTREHSPLKPAEDAYILDTSDMSLDSVIEHLVARVQERFA